MQKIKYFITGTDTGVGKTYITRLLLQKYLQQGKTVKALKPIASGVDAQGYNEDAVLLAKATNQSIEQINPICFQKPIAPSIAAKQENYELTVQNVWETCQPLFTNADVTLIEGVGGFVVPLNAKETTVDLAKKFNFPVILVVGLRLGCLNHAILTYQAIQQAGLEVAGWFANQVDPNMEAMAENIETLKDFLHAPFWGVVGYDSIVNSSYCIE